jgi:hypothetical protein
MSLVPAVGDGGTIVEQDRDIDTHDGNDGANVEVHHEVGLNNESASK